MNSYTLITDAGCDIPSALLQRWGVPCVDFTFHFDNDPKTYRNGDLSIHDFYQYLHDGRTAKTSAPNLEAFRSIFEPELRAGRDILYLGFASSLSNASQIASIAMQELLQEYPERQIIILDSLCASAGLGLLVHLCLRHKNDGMSFEALVNYARHTAPMISHWFTVDDLSFLRRGGRINSAAALAGTVLRIKPVLHMDDDGKLVNVSKARGRKNALQEIAQRYRETAVDFSAPYIISHADCPEDAALLESLVESISGHKAAYITHISSIIGAHSGPGTLSLYFLGTGR